VPITPLSSLKVAILISLWLGGRISGLGGKTSFSRILRFFEKSSKIVKNSIFSRKNRAKRGKTTGKQLSNWPKKVWNKGVVIFLSKTRFFEKSRKIEKIRFFLEKIQFFVTMSFSDPPRCRGVFFGHPPRGGGGSPPSTGGVQKKWCTSRCLRGGVVGGAWCQRGVTPPTRLTNFFSHKIFLSCRRKVFKLRWCYKNFSATSCWPPEVAMHAVGVGCMRTAWGRIPRQPGGQIFFSHEFFYVWFRSDIKNFLQRSCLSKNF